jgi:hypothetical protein
MVTRSTNTDKELNLNAAQAANGVDEQLPRKEDIANEDAEADALVEVLAIEFFTDVVNAMNTSIQAGNYDYIEKYIPTIQPWAEQSKYHAIAAMAILNDGLGMLSIVKAVVTEGNSDSKLKPFRAVFDQLIVLKNNGETVNIDDMYVDIFKKEIDARASKARREKIKEAVEDAADKIKEATADAVEETKEFADRVWQDDALRYGSYAVAAVVTGYALYKAYDYFSADGDSDITIIE